MMSEYHMVKLDGSNKLNFSTFHNKLFAIGLLKDSFHNAFTIDLPIASTHGTALPVNVEKRQKAWGHLTLALEKTPASLIRGVMTQNPFTAWTILTQWYKPSDTDAYT